VAVKRARPDGRITFLPSTLSSPPAQRVDTCPQVLVFYTAVGMRCILIFQMWPQQDSDTDYCIRNSVYYKAMKTQQKHLGIINNP